MDRGERYFECVFTDGTIENFNKLCTKVEEFGEGKDMLLFEVYNNKNNKAVTLQIIPKLHIKQIINRYSESDIKEVFEK